jgi:hypothetical protein
MRHHKRRMREVHSRSAYRYRNTQRATVIGLLVATVVCTRSDEQAVSRDVRSQRAPPRAVCEFASSPKPLDEGDVRRWSAGTFAIKFTGRRDSVAGELTLIKSSPQRERALRGPAIELAYGWTTADLERLGPMVLAYSPASQDPTRPGAQVLYDPRDKSAVLFLGGALTPEALTMDAGMELKVNRIDSSGFAGVWSSADSLRELLGGVFCARKSFAARTAAAEAP